MADKSANAKDGEVERLCREILAPMLRVDGGVMYLVSVSADEIHIHVAGTSAGCPGTDVTRERIIEPLLNQAAPKAKVRVTSGFRIPEGATKLD